MFAPEGVYEPAGMFTPAHFISLAFCIIILISAVFLTRNISEKNLRRVTLGMAIFFTVCEIVKIAYKFFICKRQLMDLDSWVPLYYCSLFIYTTWMSSCKNAYIRRIGDAFISCGCFSGGLAFLISPSTSLMIAPIWHFLSIHSMLFHTSMVYLSLMYIYKGLFQPTKKQLLHYIIILSLFMIPAATMNVIFGCNMMMLREPYNFPIRLAYIVYEFSPALWTLISAMVYCLVPFGVSSLIYLIIIKLFQNKKVKNS